MSFTVHVPATTANLGPGFDCLGLALDLWNQVQISTEGDSLRFKITGTGSSTLPKNSHNAIYQAMNAYAKHHGKSLPVGLKVHCQNNIPLGSGLGSSAAAAAAGILAAAELLGIPKDKEDQLKIASQLEGHPDNVAPCLFGGLVASVVDENKVISKSIPVQPFEMVIVKPDFVFPTHQARAALPVDIPHRDAVFNLSHTVLLLEALRSGDIDLAAEMMKDQLHQPYRIPLIPGAVEAINDGKQAGAAAVVISGAGPSLLAVLSEASAASQVAKAMSAAFNRAGLKTEIYTPSISFSGAYISKD